MPPFLHLRFMIDKQGLKSMITELASWDQHGQMNFAVHGIRYLNLVLHIAELARGYSSLASHTLRAKKAEGSGDCAYSDLSLWNAIVNFMAQPQTTVSMG